MSNHGLKKGQEAGRARSEGLPQSYGGLSDGSSSKHLLQKLEDSRSDPQHPCERQVDAAVCL